MRKGTFGGIVVVGVASAMLLATAESAHAAGTVISVGAVGTPVPVPALSSVTSGADTVGALVTVVYDTTVPSPAPFEVVPMVLSGPDMATATSGFGLWKFEITGPIFASPFMLTDAGMASEGIDKIIIDLLPSGTVWDKTLPIPPLGTPGSAAGLTFEPAGPGAPTMFTGGVDFLGSWDVVVTYIDPIETPATLGGAGDTFAALEIDFVGNSPVGVFDAGDFMDFVADTDKVVPEPASAALLGVAAPLLLRRRR